MPMLRSLSAALLAAAASPALYAISLASSPLPAAPGQELTLCAANVGRRKAQVTLKLVNVRTGAVAAQKSLTLFGSGLQPPSAEPCLSTTTAAIALAGAQPGSPADGAPPVVVGVVAIKGFGPRAPVTASLQFRTAGSSEPGQTVPLAPANLVLRAQENIIFLPLPRSK